MVVRKTFRSPTLTPPEPSSSRAPPPPTSCSGGSAPAEPVPESSNSGASGEVTEEEIAKRIEEWREIAVFLRRNVVQGVQDESGAYSAS